MSKSPARKLRRFNANRLAKEMLSFKNASYFKNKEMGLVPTLEQLYLLIGAKDGMIYDLQLSSTGLVQERDELKAQVADLQEKLAQVQLFGADSSAISLQPTSMPTQMSASTPTVMPDLTAIESDVFGATFKP